MSSSDDISRQGRVAVAQAVIGRAIGRAQRAGDPGQMFVCRIGQTLLSFGDFLTQAGQRHQESQAEIGSEVFGGENEHGRQPGKGAIATSVSGRRCIRRNISQNGYNSNLPTST